MSLTSLSSAQLRHLLQLVEEKEAIESRLAKIDQSLKALEKGTSTHQIRATTTVSRRRRRRLSLKDAILKKLQTAGREGMTVRELAHSIGVNLGSVSVWFYTTGKKIRGLRKVGKGTFTYTA